jgi:mono/diheme cytochrome c family protein
LIDDRATYLVEALGHCAQCHTPRNILGGLKTDAWLKGGKNPSGKGKIPSIHPSDLKWNKEEIVEYLSSGFTPDYDVAGGKMASVVENTSRLSESDRIYIAEYLLRLNDE